LNQPTTISAREDLPPPETCFPAHPASWYRFGSLSELRRGPLTKSLLDRELVAFRTASGRVVVLDARCPHLAADLGRGDVVGENLRCPYHQWQFRGDGRCRHAPGLDTPPAYASVRSYPVEVRHGSVFFFNDRTPRFALPFFPGLDPADFASATPFSFVAEASWIMMTAQGFDTQHFESVHDRRLLAPPRLDAPHPCARRNRYHAEIAGRSVADRLLRILAGRTVEVTITNWAGTVFLVQAEFSRACSRFLVAYRSLNARQTHCDVLVYSPCGWPRRLLPLRRWFTRAHLLAENQKIRGTCYAPDRLTAADTDLVRCFQWLAGLSPAERVAAGAAADNSPESEASFHCLLTKLDS